MKTLKWLAAGLCVLLTPAFAAAQNFPDHTIRLIVPFPPGGPNDIIARVVSQKMQAILKQTIIIDNRGGQGGVLGTDLVAKAKPDGYTIAIASAGALAISPSMEKVAYETLKDLAPVTLVAKVPEMLVVAENVPAKNMAELIALAKKQPGKLNFASSGPGSLPHLAGELFKLTFHLDLTTVPFNGAGPAIQSAVAGHTPIAFTALPPTAPQVQGGKLRGLAVTSAKRSSALPDVPTMAEAGVSGQESETMQGILVPAGTPKEIVDLLNREIVKAMALPDVKEKCAQLGFDPIANKPDEFAAYIKKEVEKWGKVIKDAKIPQIQ